MPYNNPRIQRILSDEEREKIMNLRSFKAIHFEWSFVQVTLFHDPIFKKGVAIKDSFDDDVKILKKMQFKEVEGRFGKFRKEIAKK